LGVVGGGKRVGHIPFDRPAARHGGHHQPVAETEIAETIRFKQRIGLVGAGKKGVLQRNVFLKAHHFHSC
jgi:hypothetical protein